jgi:tetratricopeptide (TPR) repeat protein
MKQTCVILMIALSIGQSYAQQSKVASAFMSLENYLKDKTDIDQLKKAKQFIDEATLSESTAGRPKTWYYRGNVYWSMNDSKDTSFTQKGENPLLTAVEAYKKAYDLDPKYDYAEECYNKAYIGYNNIGITNFNKSNFEQALENFEMCADLKAKKGNVDTSAFENAAVSAIRAKNFAKSEFYLKKLISFNKEKEGSRYIQLARLYKDKGDTATFLKTIQEGRTQFPNDQKLLTEELNLYLAGGKSAEAEKLLILAIEKDSTNAQLHYAAGTIYEDLAKRQDAIASYQKAISLKPDYWEAYFNLGAVYNNEAKRLQDIANNEKDNKKYEVLNKAAETEFKQALPYLEKALELAPKESDDVNALLRTLKQIYSRMSMTDKYEEVKKRLGQ